MSVLHGGSWKSLKFFRKRPAALAVYWAYCAMTNEDNTAWPSLRGLATITEWSYNSCRTARAWLVKHEALMKVEDYVRPEWRKLDKATRTRRVNLDKAEYFRPTGRLVIEGRTYAMLYFGATPADDELSLDGSPGESSTDGSPGASTHGAHHASGDSELDSSIELDSIGESVIEELGDLELGSITDSADASGAAQTDPQNSGGKSRKKDPLFEALCLCVNGITYDQATKGQLSRTGQFKSELVARARCKVKPPTPEEIGQFRHKYSLECKGMDFPKDVTKFADWFEELFRAEIKVNGNGTGAGTQGITPTIQYPVYGEEEESDGTTMPDV